MTFQKKIKMERNTSRNTNCAFATRNDDKTSAFVQKKQLCLVQDTAVSPKHRQKLVSARARGEA